MDKYNHRERLELILAGERPDRFAASFWRHFYHLEHHAEGTIEAMSRFQKRFDWDFVKVNPRADYHVEGWGLRQIWSHDEFKKHTKQEFPVSNAADWKKIEPLGLEAPALAEHLKVVAGVRREIGHETPILMTVFTPLSIAGRMVADRRTLVSHLSECPDVVEAALAAITETFVSFVTELRNAGADGIFYATTQWASGDTISWEQYERFGVPYDLKVIDASGEGAINLLHVCSSHNFLKQLLAHDYPCRMLSWDSCDPTNTPLDKAFGLIGERVAVGGVDQCGWLLNSNPVEVGSQIEKIKTTCNPRRLIIGPGCSIPPQVPMDNLQAIRDKL